MVFCGSKDHLQMIPLTGAQNSSTASSEQKADTTESNTIFSDSAPSQKWRFVFLHVIYVVHTFPYVLKKMVRRAISDRRTILGSRIFDFFVVTTSL